MSRMPLWFRLPTKCIFCGAVGTVVPETTIRGDAVLMAWCCRSCNNDWPITDEQTMEDRRRIGLPDTRDTLRTERRQTEHPKARSHK